jgi:chromosome segregation ATPase
MMTGKDNLQLINHHIQQAQTEQENDGRRLEELHRQLNALRLEIGERYRELARLRLDNFKADQVISRLDETDQVILKLLEKLKHDRRNLEEQIKASVSQQRQLEEQREELGRQRDETGEEIRQKLEQTHNRIKETEAYRQQQERAQEAVAVVKHADEKVSQAENDRIEKGKPYEADGLFMYLWNRRYLTTDYRGGWFTRKLDGWVSKLIDFRRNRANYHMLQELPRRLREHATKVQQTAQLEVQALKNMEREAAAADGIPAFQAEMQEAEKQLQELDTKIDAEEARNQKLLEEQAHFNAGTDPLSKQIIDLQTAELVKDQMANLYQMARATPRPEDDAIVAQLHQLRQREDQIVAEIQSVNNLLQQQQRNLGELQEVRRRYRQSGYDSYNSSFPGDFTLGMLLGQLLQGMTNSDTVWQEIGRHHHSSGPVGGRGDFDGGFGDMGGDMGGFGGGDGFRTGGGF